MVVLGATNRLDMVDPALRARDVLTWWSTSQCRTVTPAGRFSPYTPPKPLAPDVDLNTLAEFSEGLMGGDIASICRRATMHAIRDHVEHQGANRKGCCSRLTIFGMPWRLL